MLNAHRLQLRTTAGLYVFPHRGGRRSAARLASQRGDFLYLTGVTQSGLVAAITARGSGAAPRFTLFTPPSLAERDRWDGARMRPEAAAEIFGADDAYPCTEV